MQTSLHPIFAGILASIEQQPLQLHRAATKAAPRRFLNEPHEPSAFGSIDQIGSDRHREVRDQEHADQRADERRERDARGE